MALAGGVAAALFRRARTGEGAVVDVALLGSAMWCLQMPIVGAAVDEGSATRPSRADRRPECQPQFSTLW